MSGRKSVSTGGNRGTSGETNQEIGRLLSRRPMSTGGNCGTKQLEPPIRDFAESQINVRRNELWERREHHEILAGSGIADQCPFDRRMERAALAKRPSQINVHSVEEWNYCGRNGERTQIESRNKCPLEVTMERSREDRRERLQINVHRRERWNWELFQSPCPFSIVADQLSIGTNDGTTYIWL
jgi:hypothetical protein